VVVAGERLARRWVWTSPEAAEAVGARPGAPDVRQLERVSVADDHRLDVALAVEEHPHLAVGLEGDLGQVARQLGGDHLRGVHPAAVGAAERVQLALLEAEGVPVDVLHSPRGA